MKLEHWCSLLIAIQLVLLAAPLSADDRYVAFFADGKRAGNSEVKEWHDTAAQPRIGDQKLLDPKNPVRWLIDTELSCGSPPESFVELVGGDRLPGSANAYRTGMESAFNQLPSHLLVDPEVAVEWPDPRQRRQLRVLTRWLRRVVWQARGSDSYQPGTVFYLDGRQVAYRALRWTEEGVRLLLAEGTSEVPFSQIAELHLPSQDAWNAYFEQAAIVCPDGNSRLLQIETDNGVRVTASTERFQARNNGSHADHWFHGFQPAWCLEPLWLRHRTIRVRSYFAPHEVTLSRLEPAKVEQQFALGAGWHWQANLNVQAGPLRNNGQDFGWGLGVHAHCSLRYDLHPLVRTFRTRVGLDDVAGKGGCARGQVFYGAVAGKPAYESPLLVGSSESFESGALSVPVAPSPEDGARKAADAPAGPASVNRLTLVADAVYHDRPAGTDPLDIRDTVDWLEPLLELDPDGLRAEIARRVERQVPAWQGWTLAESDSGPAALVNYWDDTDARNLRFQPLVAARHKLLLLTRRIEVTPEHRNLLLAVSRFTKDTMAAKLQVQVDGKPIGQFDVPERRSPGEPDPLMIPLDKYLGKQITLGVAQLPLGPKSLIDWRGIQFADHWPGLWPLFEDEARFAEQLRQGTDTPTLEAADKYAGTASLRFLPVMGSDPHRIDLNLPIRENPKLGEFRYLRFAWKKRGTGRICLSLGHDNNWGPDDTLTPREQMRRSFRFEAGQGDPSYGAALRTGPLPQEWTVITRDLFADFGPFTLTGLSLSAPDGDAAQFDHIYLGRWPTDFDRSTVKPKP